MMNAIKKETTVAAAVSSCKMGKNQHMKYITQKKKIVKRVCCGTGLSAGIVLLGALGGIDNGLMDFRSFLVISLACLSVIILSFAIGGDL